MIIIVRIIISLNVYSNFVQKYFGIFSSVAVSISLSAINIITPKLLEMITKFESWDYPETEINMLLLRMYLSTILNLVFIVFSYILLANPVLISSYSYLADLQIARSWILCMSYGSSKQWYLRASGVQLLHPSYHSLCQWLCKYEPTSHISIHATKEERILLPPKSNLLYISCACFSHDIYNQSVGSFALLLVPF